MRHPAVLLTKSPSAAKIINRFMVDLLINQVPGPGAKVAVPGAVTAPPPHDVSHGLAHGVYVWHGAA
jgi:hypothetical protein